MELKDKIYVREFQEGINQMWDGNKRENTSAIAHHEYIRKDALLEWLQDCKNNPAITDIQKGNIQELIEKINSL